jgi:hypothetical protein
MRERTRPGPEWLRQANLPPAQDSQFQEETGPPQQNTAGGKAAESVWRTRQERKRARAKPASSVLSPASSGRSRPAAPPASRGPAPLAFAASGVAEREGFEYIYLTVIFHIFLSDRGCSIPRLLPRKGAHPVGQTSRFSVDPASPSAVSQSPIGRVAMQLRRGAKATGRQLRDEVGPVNPASALDGAGIGPLHYPR